MLEASGLAFRHMPLNLDEVATHQALLKNMGETIQPMSPKCSHEQRLMRQVRVFLERSSLEPIKSFH